MCQRRYFFYRYSANDAFTIPTAPEKSSPPRRRPLHRIALSAAGPFLRAPTTGTGIGCSLASPTPSTRTHRTRPACVTSVSFRHPLHPAPKMAASMAERCVLKACPDPYSRGRSRPGRRFGTTNVVNAVSNARRFALPSRSESRLC